MRSFEDSFDLVLLFSNPLATDINLRLFLNIEAAKEYFSYDKNPVVVIAFHDDRTDFVEPFYRCIEINRSMPCMSCEFSMPSVFSV